MNAMKPSFLLVVGSKFHLTGSSYSPSNGRIPNLTVERVSVMLLLFWRCIFYLNKIYTVCPWVQYITGSIKKITILYLVICKMLVLIYRLVQPTLLVKLITIPSISNPTAALVSTVCNWTINSIRTILIEMISILPKMIYTMPTISPLSKPSVSFPLCWYFPRLV